MTGKIPASSVEIVDILFDFIEDHFDKFKHRYEPKHNGQEKWWWINHEYGKDRGARGESWAPFVEACFVMEGEITTFNVGHCYGNDTHNVENFIEDTFKRPYNHSKHPCDSSSKGGGGGIDVSWRGNDNKYFLALEHSENRHPDPGRGICDKFNKGKSDSNAQLRGICDEICKLKDKHSKFNIIVSRPNIRYRDNYIFSSVVNDFKKNIEDILSHINPPSEEIWIVILIAPQTHVRDPIMGMMINFHCYEWNGKQLSLIKGDRNYSFEVKTANGFVRKV